MIIKLAFLGTGTCNSTQRNPSALALSDGNDNVLIDCGGGCYHQLSRLNSDYFRHDAVSTIILTHFHMDHVSGLADLIWGEMWDMRIPRTRPLLIAGPPGTTRLINERLIPFIGHHPVRFRIETIELSDGEIFTGSFFTARSFKTAHDNASSGFLITADRTRLAITGDTGFCDNLAALLSGSDIAVMEWSHTDPEGVANHISGADIMRLIQLGVMPRRVYITHMYPPAGGTFNDEARRKRELLGQHADRFVFPEDMDIIDMGE